MSERRKVDARIGARWGAQAVLLEIVGGEPLRAPLPPRIKSEAIEGRLVSVYLNATDRLEGWALSEEKVGVRMCAELSRWGPPPSPLNCQGPCQTLWYFVSGGTVSPSEAGCLTCGTPVAA